MPKACSASVAHAFTFYPTFEHVNTYALLYRPLSSMVLIFGFKVTVPVVPLLTAKLAQTLFVLVCVCAFSSIGYLCE